MRYTLIISFLPSYVLAFAEKFLSWSLISISSPYWLNPHHIHRACLFPDSFVTLKLWGEHYGTIEEDQIKWTKQVLFIMRLKIRAYSRTFFFSVNIFVKRSTFYKIHIMEQAITSLLIIYDCVSNVSKLAYRECDSGTEIFLTISCVPELVCIRNWKSEFDAPFLLITRRMSAV